MRRTLFTGPNFNRPAFKQLKRRSEVERNAAANATQPSDALARIGQYETPPTFVGYFYLMGLSFSVFRFPQKR